MEKFHNSLTFKHGIHPSEFKHFTNNCAIERMPFTEQYILPLGQHIGAPSIPIVKIGDKVKRGQRIAEPGGYVSVALHTPVDGVVTNIGLSENQSGQMANCIFIQTDTYSPQLLQTQLPKPPQDMDMKEFLSSIQNAGIVGLGGAAFPAHAKFAVPEGKRIKYLMLNGCECEPFLTSDHRTMVEYSDELLDGVSILNHHIKAEKIFIGIENNKPDAIEILKAKCTESLLNIVVVPLKVKYPQGAEKMMISAILGYDVPSGKLPLDVGVLVSNVGTIAALSTWFRQGQPLIERIVTITGTAIKRPSNLLVPIGTSMQEVIDYCGGIINDAARILYGGPMMGMVQKSLNTPVIKGTSGLLVLTKNEVKDTQEFNCIRCGKCVDACPMFLNPSLLGLLAKKGLWEEMNENHVLDCFECGSCSFVCPSGIPLVQSFRVAKGLLREKKARESIKNS